MKGRERIIAFVIIACMTAGAACTWFGARIVARPSMMHVLLDPPRPTPTPQPVPKSFLDAGRLACEHYVVDYKLWLALRWCEMGRRDMEMGIQGRNAAIETRHPFFPQAYWAAYIMAKRQQEFCASKELQQDYAKYKDPYIAYFCQRWHPWQWAAYYWDANGNGVGATYSKCSVKLLEKRITEKVIEKWGNVW